MWWFFIFLGIMLVSTIGSVLNGSKDIMMRNSEKAARFIYRHIKDELENKDVDRKIDALFYEEGHEGIRKEIKEELVKIFGEDYRDKYSKIKVDVYKTIISSREGAIYGDPLKSFLVNSEYSLRACKIIEDNLIAAGKTFRMYQEPNRYSWESMIYDDEVFLMRLYDDQCPQWFTRARRVWKDGQEDISLQQIEREYPSVKNPRANHY